MRATRLTWAPPPTQTSTHLRGWRSGHRSSPTGRTPCRSRRCDPPDRPILRASPSRRAESRRRPRLVIRHGVAELEPHADVVLLSPSSRPRDRRSTRRSSRTAACPAGVAVAAAAVAGAAGAGAGVGGLGGGGGGGGVATMNQANTFLPSSSVPRKPCSSPRTSRPFREDVARARRRRERDLCPGGDGLLARRPVVDAPRAACRPCRSRTPSTVSVENSAAGCPRAPGRGSSRNALPSIRRNAFLAATALTLSLLLRCVEDALAGELELLQLGR